MTALLVVVMIILFLAVDLTVRALARRFEERRILRQREAVLQTAIRLDFTNEAPSLKRVEVPDARARILAVDDEPVVLDSLRKILVLDGFSVDTVENGPEALGLVRRNNYDFVFTDLKMPGMDGVEVVKAVRHLRPDIDVAVITGYGTVETAVETMQHGAVEYVLKPFTADELTEFARKLLIKREARLESQRMPAVRVVAPAAAEHVASHEFCVPGGAFVSPGHVWARIEPGGQVRIGLDDFARKALGPVDSIETPQKGASLGRGSTAFTVKRGDRHVSFVTPITGRVTHVNGALAEDPIRMTLSPYDRGWVCLIQPAELAAELPDLLIGQPVVGWYQTEIKRLRALEGPTGPGSRPVDWTAFGREFLAATSPVSA